MSNEQVKNNKKGLWISILVTVILIPAVFIASPYLGDRNMYITSVIVMILSMVPFFASFESHKPHARELVILSVMVSLQSMRKKYLSSVLFFTNIPTREKVLM